MLKFLLALALAMLTVLNLVGCADPADDLELEHEMGEMAIQSLTAAGGPKSYIITLRDGVDTDSTLDALAKTHGATVVHRYHHVMNGGSMLLPTDEARSRLEADSRVAAVEADIPMQAVAAPTTSSTPPAQSLPTGYRLIGANTINNTGAGQRVAVLDTGADLDHLDLAANLDLGLLKDCVNEGGMARGDDANGHGSHTAGTIAAVSNTIGSIGVGPGIKVVPVKVLNRQGSGSWSTIICGVDYVTSMAGVIQVASMSLGGSGTECNTSSCTKSALQLAIERSVAAGVTYAVAAGNDGLDASKSVPAAYDAVITVSAYKDGNGTLDSTDGWPSWTNFGADVDIAAPGVNIYSTWKNNGYNTISGTSMATPHVAAAAALYLAKFPGSTPAQVRDGLRSLAITTYPGSTDAKHAEPLLDIRALGF